MERRIALTLCFIVFLSSFVLSEIALTEPNDIYNLGDKLFVTATNLKGSETGNLNIDLKCKNGTAVNLLKISARAFSTEGGQAYSIPYKILSKEDLEIDNIQSIIGKCSIVANLADDVYETKSFTITNELNLAGSIDKLKYNPGEEAILELNVKRADGEPFGGSYKITNFTEDQGEIIEGRLEKTIKIENNKAPGSYFLKIEAFNQDSEGEVTNNGSLNLLIIVNQIPTNIEPSISSSEIIPGEEIKLNPKIIDQAGGLVEGTIAVHLIDPLENKKDFTVTSGETLTIPFPYNSTQGTWKIYFVANELTAESEFNMLGLEKVNYSLVNGILKIENIGNMDYFGEVAISIGETTEKVEVKLKVGEQKEFVLEAPEGEYEINVDDGRNSFSENGFLTGNAVGIKEVGGSVVRGFSFMWIFLVFLVGSLGIVMVGMYRRTKTFSKSSFKDKMKNVSPFKKVKKEPLRETTEEKDIIDLTNKRKLENAESSLVLDGEKVESTVVSVKIKDKDDFSEEIQHEIVKIIQDSCGDKGVVDVKEDFIYMIYSPLVTKSYRNEFLATTIALKLQKDISEYKKKMSGDLKYGIGVHEGDLISKKEGKKLKYTSIGNTLSFANKMAEISEENVLISEKIRRQLIRDLKVTKVDEINGSGVYSVDEVKNKAQNEAKLKDLLGRMGQNQP